MGCGWWVPACEVQVGRVRGGGGGGGGGEVAGLGGGMGDGGRWWKESSLPVLLCWVVNSGWWDNGG